MHLDHNLKFFARLLLILLLMVGMQVGEQMELEIVVMQPNQMFRFQYSTCWAVPVQVGQAKLAEQEGVVEAGIGGKNKQSTVQLCIRWDRIEYYTLQVQLQA